MAVRHNKRRPPCLFQRACRSSVARFLTDFPPAKNLAHPVPRNEPFRAPSRLSDWSGLTERPSPAHVEVSVNGLGAFRVSDRSVGDRCGGEKVRWPSYLFASQVRWA